MHLPSNAPLAIQMLWFFFSFLYPTHPCLSLSHHRSVAVGVHPSTGSIELKTDAAPVLFKVQDLGERSCLLQQRLSGMSIYTCMCVCVCVCMCVYMHMMYMIMYLSIAGAVYLAETVRCVFYLIISLSIYKRIYVSLSLSLSLSLCVYTHPHPHTHIQQRLSDMPSNLSVLMFSPLKFSRLRFDSFCSSVWQTFVNLRMFVWIYVCMYIHECAYTNTLSKCLFPTGAWLAWTQEALSNPETVGSREYPLGEGASEGARERGSAGARKRGSEGARERGRGRETSGGPCSTSHKGPR